MLDISFLTLPDPRVKPSGSRDPLGFQTIWVKLGRELVGENLTTITSSIDNFIIALLACHYAFKEENEAKKMEIFFKVEQLGAYFRIAANHKNSIMGITQAEKNYKANKIKLGSDSEAQIFGNQKTSGLWGYYSSALMMTGLINKDKDTVEENGMRIINKVINKFSLDEFLNSTSLDIDVIEANAEKFIQVLGTVYKDMVDQVLKKSEFDIYDKAKSFFELNEDDNSYKNFYIWMKKSYSDEPLTQKLYEIKKVDKALWVAGKVFEFCRTQKGKTVDKVVDDIAKSPLSKIRLAQSNLKIKKFIDFWNSEQYDKAVRELIDIHSKAMKNRSSVKWVSLQNDDKLKVTVSSKMSLPELVKTIPWQYNYFLHSYLSVAYQVYIEGRKHG